MKTVHRIIGAQMAVTAVAVALVLLMGGEAHAAWSALIGGVIGFSTAYVYVRRMFASRGADPADVLKAQYRAEFYKLAFTAVLFGATFVLFRDVAALPLFLTYAATLMVYWAALLFA
jgi:ATP synthase protein I